MVVRVVRVKVIDELPSGEWLLLYASNRVRIYARFGLVEIEAPYNALFVSELRRLDGRFWDSVMRRNAIRTPYRSSVRRALELTRYYFDEKIDVDRLVAKLDELNFDPNLVIEYSGGKFYFLRPLPFDKSGLYSIMKLYKASLSKNGGNTVYVVSVDDPQKVIQLYIEVFRFARENGWKVLITKGALKKVRELALGLAKVIGYSSATRPPEKVEIGLPDGLELYDFQKHAVWWLENVASGRGLIADEMGLGKTIETLAWLRVRKELRPVVIVCPASVKLNWAEEVRKWLDEPVQVLRGRNATIKRNASIYIVNYDILSDNLEKLIELEPKVLVLDEAHYIKNIKAKRTKSALKLAEVTPYVIALTGTPILNSAIELFPILVALGKLENTKKAYWNFAKKFAYIEEVETRNGTVTVIKGVRNARELNRLLRSGIMLRRTKEQVFDQLPAKRRILIKLEVDEDKYMRELNEFSAWIRELKDEIEKEWDNILAKVEKLRQLSALLKLENALDFVKNVLAQEDKLVVFAHHHDVIKKTLEELEKLKEKEEFRGLKVLKIVGGMSSEEKQKVVEEFNSSEKAVIVVSIRAGGEGINLQTSNVAVFLELDWTPARILQAEDRLHRIGQSKHVDYYYLIAQGTIEETMYETIVEKLEAITEATEVKKATFKIIKEELAKTGLDLQKLIEEREAELTREEERKTERRVKRRRKQAVVA